MAAGQLDIVVLPGSPDPRPPVRIATGAVTVRHTGLRTVVNPRT